MTGDSMMTQHRKNNMSEFVDRMKMYEDIEASRRFIPCVPIIARMDGRNFSKLKGLNKPFDNKFKNAMLSATIGLVAETNACIGYTASDEITLIFYSDNIKSQIWFDGRISKMVSQLAALTTVYFNAHMKLNGWNTNPYDECFPTFDARCWQVPNQIEACNVLQWREGDATRNSISMLARSLYSHKELLNKSTKDMLVMIEQAGHSWQELHTHYKRGTYIARRNTVQERFAPTELGLPIFETIENKIDVVFNGQPVSDNRICQRIE